VTTVGQRCTLTKLTLRADKEKHVSPAILAQLQESLNGCYEQLTVVKSINAHTPDVK
jgi:hypothetical protein